MIEARPYVKMGLTCKAARLTGKKTLYLLSAVASWFPDATFYLAVWIYLSCVQIANIGGERVPVSFIA